MEAHQILYVGIARTSLKKILFEYLPNKKEKKNLELYNMDMMDLLQTEGQSHYSKQTDYGHWHAEFDSQSQLCFAVLTNQGFPVDKALILLGEIQSKIYENFPKIQKEYEEESLAGAKIYVSDICSKYSIEDIGEAANAQLKMQEAQQNIKHESIQLQIQANPPPKV